MAADAKPQGVSFCTTCYNRLSFLQQTLPRNLACLDPRDEIVLTKSSEVIAHTSVILEQLQRKLTA
jgi:hypothetical protein